MSALFGSVVHVSEDVRCQAPRADLWTACEKLAGADARLGNSIELILTTRGVLPRA